MRVFSFLFILFFFSSRRRHTRLQGDWSSDVCSSDLYRAVKDTINLGPRSKVKIAWIPDNRPGMWMYHCHILEHHAAGMMARSEERRVGKECRARRSREQ